MGQSGARSPRTPAWQGPARAWRDWPAARSPGRAGLAGILVLATVLGIGLESAALGVLAALLLVGATFEFFAPTQFEVDERGARATRAGHRRALAWEQVVAVAPHPRGLLLVASGSRPWLARRRSLLLAGAPPEVHAALAPDQAEPR